MLRLGPTKLGKYLGVSRQSIYRAEKSGHITRGPDGKFNPEQARREWLSSTTPTMGNIHMRMKEVPPEPDLTTQHTVLTIIQQSWAISLRSMALCLRELDTFDEKNRHFACLSIMFLLQWKIVGEDLGLPESHLLEFTHDMATLIQEGGGEELERWLKKQSRIDFRAEYPAS